MLIDFETYPNGIPITVDTRQVTTVGATSANPELTVIRFADGREVIVRGATEEVSAQLGQSGQMRLRGLP